MNLSGRSVEQAYRKVGGGKWGGLCVVHDDLEVALGDFTVRQRGKGKYVTFLLCDLFYALLCFLWLLSCYGFSGFRGLWGIDGRGHNGIASCIECLRTEVCVHKVDTKD